MSARATSALIGGLAIAYVASIVAGPLAAIAQQLDGSSAPERAEAASRWTLALAWPVASWVIGRERTPRLVLGRAFLWIGALLVIWTVGLVIHAAVFVARGQPGRLDLTAALGIVLGAAALMQGRRMVARPSWTPGSRAPQPGAPRLGTDSDSHR